MALSSIAPQISKCQEENSLSRSFLRPDHIHCLVPLGSDQPVLGMSVVMEALDSTPGALANQVSTLALNTYQKPDPSLLLTNLAISGS